MSINTSIYLRSVLVDSSQDQSFIITHSKKKKTQSISPPKVIISPLYTIKNVGPFSFGKL